jgi:hypothetical protein
LVRAIVALVAAVATPLIFIYGIAVVLVPGVPLSASSGAFWSALLFSGLAAAALLCLLPRLRLGGALAVGAATGILCVTVFTVLVNLFPAIASSI